ncbi:hypothetical protein ACYATO_04545 [Lactobacillaceae bacterium Melli_B3]
MQLNNKKWVYTVAVSSLMLIGNGVWHSNNIVNADSDNRSTSSATTKSKKTTKLKKSSDSNSKAKTAKFAASIYNLPKSTKGVISQVKYSKNLVNDVSIDLTISDATLNNIYDKELKRLCFNMYRKVKGEAQKAGLSLDYFDIVDEQGDLLASYWFRPVRVQEN